MNYWVPFILSLVLSWLLTGYIRDVAVKYNWLAKPRKRDAHQKPTPRLGGVALFLSFFIIILFFAILNPSFFNFNSTNLNFWGFEINKHLFGILLGALVIFGAMVWDDIKGMPTWAKFFWQIAAVLIIIASGIGIDYISNPFGGFIRFDQIQIPLGLFGNTYHITLWADLFTIFWLVGMMNVINFLDGLDGLAGGVSFISVFVIFFLSLTPSISQFATAFLAITLAGSILGFLPKNFHPAKIFMGDSGSMFLGFMLGVLAIISGGKVATAFLVLGFPIIDGLWVAIRRIKNGTSPFKADNTHLHHLMLKAGIGYRQTVLTLYFITATFGIISLFLGTREKFFAIIWLILILAIIVMLMFYLTKKKEKRT